ncbi:MAG: PorP/SprF family type IX secretion system membrane protein [Saprospiraceae bacterium]|nr:PorP/SprF family type IX secretion system membrane protein [Saprospiraceae bacterium]
MHKLIPAFALVLFSLRLAAQDLHFSQFNLNPLRQNPALAGVFRGNWRLSTHYRSQWQSIPVPYRTYAAAYDWKAYKRGNTLIAPAIQIEHDRAGDAGLTWTQVNLGSGVSQALGEWQAISAGFGLGFAQRKFDISALSFQNQWDGDQYDPNRDTRERMGDRSNLVALLSAGVNWHLENPDHRDRFDVGVGAFHLNRPDISFVKNANNPLPVRWAATATGLVELQQFFDALAFATFQQMGGAQEIVVGGGGKFWLAREIGNDMAIQATLAYRHEDAIIPAIFFEYNEWQAGVSYDVNFSSLQTASARRGGFEIAVIYRTLPVPPIKGIKVCPIF